MPDVQPTFKSFEQSLTDMLRYYYGATGTPPDVEPGAIDMAAYEAVAFEIEQVSYAFDSTLANGNVASTLEAFGVVQQQSAPASVTLVFSRAAPATEDILIPAFDTIVQTASGIQFKTIEAKTLLTGTTNVSVKAQTLDNGKTGNVDANTITTLNTGISGIEAVTNPNPAAGGTNAESIAQLIARANRAIAKNAKGTLPAMTATALEIPDPTTNLLPSAVLVVDAYLDASIPVGTAYVFAFVPGGSSQAHRDVIFKTLTLEQRPVGLKILVFDVPAVTQDVNLTVYASDVAAVAAVNAAVRAMFDAIGIGEDVNADRIQGVAHGAHPSIYAVTVATPTTSTTIPPYSRATIGTFNITYVSGGIR